MTTYAVVERDGAPVVIGAFLKSPGGYRFVPWNAAHKPSRKLWETAAEALPRWARAARVIEARDTDQAVDLYRIEKAAESAPLTEQVIEVPGHRGDYESLKVEQAKRLYRHAQRMERDRAKLLKQLREISTDAQYARVLRSLEEV